MIDTLSLFITLTLGGILFVWFVIVLWVGVMKMLRLWWVQPPELKWVNAFAFAWSIIALWP